MKYHLIRDSTKIEKILNIIIDLKEKEKETKLIKINRICKYTVHIYFQINENESVYFKVYFPSNYAINEMKLKEKEK